MKCGKSPIQIREEGNLNCHGQEEEMIVTIDFTGIKDNREIITCQFHNSDKINMYQY